MLLSFFIPLRVVRSARAGPPVPLMTGSKSVKITADLHTELTERKHRPSEALEDVIRREMDLPPRTELLSPR
jgi:hypothetical protein